MPIVAHNSLPTFERLNQEGVTVMSPERASQQDIRELHFGLLNMMPDAALEATERQFFRLVGESNPIAQFHVHPFSLPELPRGKQAREHIARYYEDFESIRREGLDGLIITGANVSQPDLEKEPFWEPLMNVYSWARENVTSVLCSCLASHAVLQYEHDIHRRPLPDKCWGVYPHTVVERTHPLVHDVNTLFDVPHSRYNEVTREQIESVGLHVLVESDAGVHLAVSRDGFRTVYFQGHPEFDVISLLKEYKREVMRFARGERSDYPPFPENYFSAQSRAIFNEYRERLEQALAEGGAQPVFPEQMLIPLLHNTWHDTGDAVVGNWIGLVYQLTSRERAVPFMDGVNPGDPVGWLAKKNAR
ncbi:homoserine O-succinyltransferase [Granulosicoccaceae sp. 1_MG-2023]|nr:homoserine O-succinyltransferase [Granulosicoccaceae sp. 1_MG-2023]